MNERGIRRVEDLDVFGRGVPSIARAPSSQPEGSADRAICVGRLVAPRIEIDLRELGRGFRQAGLFCGGVSALSVGRDWQ